MIGCKLKMTNNMQERPFHSVCALFPLMDRRASADLQADIARNGVRQPLWLHPDGSVIDGRNRYNACKALDVEPPYQTWDGQGSLTDFVVSLNLTRRHLSDSQRAHIGAKIAKLLKAETKRGRKAAGEVPQGKISEQVAETMHVSPRMIEAAQQVVEFGDAQLNDAVASGDVAVTAAAEIVNLPKAEQRRLVEEGPEAVREAASKKRETRERFRSPEPKSKTMVVHAEAAVPEPAPAVPLPLPEIMVLEQGTQISPPLTLHTRISNGVRVLGVSVEEAFHVCAHTFKRGAMLKPGMKVRVKINDQDGWSVDVPTTVVQHTVERLTCATTEALNFIDPASARNSEAESDDAPWKDE